MFAADGEGNYKFYDFDKFFGTPREIGSGNNTLVKDNYPVMFATGLEAGIISSATAAPSKTIMNRRNWRF